MNTTKNFLFIFFLLRFTHSAYADDFFDALGFSNNTTSPGIIKDQQGFHLSGGSFTARSRVANQQIASAQLPTIKAGCGGIDIYMGSFSFVNGDQFKQLGKSIMQNAAGYAVELALDTMSPQMTNTLNKIRSITNLINGQSINSCQMGASIASGLFPKSEAGKRMACSAQAMGSNAVSDYAASRYDCSTRNDSNINSKKQGDKANGFESLLAGEYNLVHRALTQGGIRDKKFISTLMSVSGTLISKKNSAGKIELTFKPSLFTSPEAISSLLFNDNSKSMVYRCSDNNDSECLTIEKRPLGEKIKASGLYEKTRQLIGSIADKIRNERKGSSVALTSEESKLISTSSIPILNIISLEIASRPSSGDITLGTSEYIELIAYDMLVNYLEELLDITYRATNNLEHAQMDGSQIKAFKQEMTRIQQTLRDNRVMAVKRAGFIMQTKQWVTSFEKKMKMLLLQQI